MKLVLGRLLEHVVCKLGVATLDTPQVWLEGLQHWAADPAVQSQLEELAPALKRSLGAVDRTTATRWAAQLSQMWQLGQPGYLGRGLSCELSEQDDRWLTPHWGPTPAYRVARVLAGLVWFMAHQLLTQPPQPVRDVRGRSLIVHGHDRLTRQGRSESGWERVDQARQYLRVFWLASQEVYREADPIQSRLREESGVPATQEPSPRLQGVIYCDPHSGVELFFLPALMLG